MAMGHACCTHDDIRRTPPGSDHPVTAILAVVAILAAILLIGWARVALHGTDDIAALVEDQPAAARTAGAEDEAASSRWATGFSH
jgi:hypothetical protein